MLLRAGLFTKTIGLGNAILIVSACGAVIALVAVAFLPETKGKDILNSAELLNE